MGMRLDKETSRKPLKTNSSKIGASMAVTANKLANVKGSGEMIFTTSSTVLAPWSCTKQEFNLIRNSELTANTFLIHSDMISKHTQWPFHTVS